MSLASAVGAATFDRTANTFMLDLSTELSQVIRPDNNAFLSRVGEAGMTAEQIAHYWSEDELNPNSATAEDSADGVLTASGSDTSLDITSGQEGRFKVGTLFMDTATGKSEVMQVSAITDNVLTITRGYGSTSAETHAQNFTIHIVAHPKQQGWKPAQEDWTQERSSQYNYVQIFGRGITIAYERQKVDQSVIASEIAHQTAYRLKEIVRELDSVIINGIRSESAPSDSVYGTLGGLREFVSASGGNTTTTTESLTENVVNEMVKQVWDDAGQIDNGFILVGSALKRVISTFDQAYRRSDFSTRMAGFTVEKFLSDLGIELEVIVDPWMPADVMILGDLSKIKCGPLQGDAMALEDLAKTGRVHEMMISGGYTLEVRNALKCFAYHNNLS